MIYVYHPVVTVFLLSTFVESVEALGKQANLIVSLNVTLLANTKIAISLPTTILSPL